MYRPKRRGLLGSIQVATAAGLYLVMSLSVMTDPLTFVARHLQALTFQTSITQSIMGSGTFQHEEGSKTVPVFYNLFLNSEEDRPRVQDLVVDQLSYLDPSKHNPVYINSLKTPWDLHNLQEAVNQRIVQKKLNNTADPSQLVVPPPFLKLTLLQHYDAGDEDKTLHALWSHCQRYSDHTVMYLHDKGSFHPNSRNEMLRQFLSAGATSEACYQGMASINSTTSCNLCGYRFSPLPHLHFPGNMWMAQCEYIQQLADPLLFSEQMEEVVESVNLLENPLQRSNVWEYVRNHIDKFDRLHQRFWKYAEERLNQPDRAHTSCIGRDRFAMEHWVASHPFATPCDLEENPKFRWGMQGLSKMVAKEYSTKDLKAAPRFPVPEYTNPRSACHLARGVVLKDRIDEYNALYPDVNVTDNWWGWRTGGFLDDFRYPDGSPWQWFLRGTNETLPTSTTS